MSYIITVKYPSHVLAAAAEASARGDQVDRLKVITERGREFGCIHHLFAEDTDGSVIVIDEWPDEDSLQRFLADQGSEIDVVGQAWGAEAGEQPEVTVRRILDTPDRF